VLLESGRTRRFGAGEPLFAAGAEAPSMIGIATGSVEFRVHAVDGLETMIHICHPGYWFGTGPAVARQVRPFSAFARTDLTVSWAPMAEIIPRLDREPTLWRSLGRIQQKDFELAICVAADLMLRDHRARIAAALLRLAGLRPDFGCHAPGLHIVVSQEEIAGLVNLSRNHAAVALRHLAGQGAISLGYRATRILDPAMLQAWLHP
jgi:CRP-like cAMP-binding protein